MPRTQIVPLQENKAISQNDSDDSDEHDISEIAQSGMFSIQVIISDTSTSTSITITYLLSLDGINCQYCNCNRHKQRTQPNIYV